MDGRLENKSHGSKRWCERRTGFMKTHSGIWVAEVRPFALGRHGVADPTHHDRQVGANSPLKKSAFQAFLPGQNLRGTFAH